MPFQHEAWTNLNKLLNLLLLFDITFRGKLCIILLNYTQNCQLFPLVVPYFKFFFFWLVVLLNFPTVCIWVGHLYCLVRKRAYVKDIHTSVFVYVISKGNHFEFSSDQCIILNQQSLFRNNVVTKFWKWASIVNLYSS